MRAALLPAGLAALGVWAPSAVAGAPRDFEQAVPAVPRVASATAAPGGAATRVIRAPRRFDLLGLRWRRGTEPRIWVRVRRGGRWSRWVFVPRAHGPIARRGQEGSEPVWAGGADAYQLRLSRPVRGLRAHFVRVPRPGLARAAAIVGRPPIVPRAQWGASQCPPREAPGYGRVNVGFVHHTVNANDYTAQESPAIVLAICRYHRNSNGWSDVGYNFLVDRHGQVFEGRAGGIDRAVVGAQAAGYNSVSTGVANIGEFSDEPQSEAGTAALARLLAWKLGLHGVPAEGAVTTAGRTFQRISGHRDANSTSCPGDALYAQLPDLRRRVATGAFGGAPAAGLTFNAPPRVRVPDVPTFSGSLSGPDGTPLGGRAVELQARLSAGGWRPVSTAVTGPEGSWSLQLPTTRSGTFRASFEGDGAAPSQVSAARRVLVAPRIQVRATRSRVRWGQRVTLAGTVEPAKRPLEVLVWRRSRGANRFAGRFGAIERGTRFTARLRLGAATVYRFQVTSRGDTRNAAGRSNVVWVRATG